MQVFAMNDDDAIAIRGNRLSSDLQLVRELLHSGATGRAIEIGIQLGEELTDPSDLATLHFLMGRAELFNGRLAPAVQRFRMMDHGDLSPSDRLRVGMWEAFSRYGAGGLDAVSEVVDEVERSADNDKVTIAAIAGMRAWMCLERGQTSDGVKQAIAANQMAIANGGSELVSLSWLVLSIAHATAGQTPLALKAIATGIEHAQQSGYRVAVPMIHLIASEMDAERGRLAHAIRHARLAIDQSEPISGGLVGVWGHGLLSQLHDRIGDDTAARDHLLSAERSLLRGAPLGWGHLAIARLRADRHDNSERAAQRLLDVWRFIDDHGTSGHPNLFALPIAALATRLTNPATKMEFIRLLNGLIPHNNNVQTVNSLACAVLADDLSLAIELAETLERSGDAFATTAADAFAVIADLCESHGDRRERSFAEAARELYEKSGAHGDIRRLLHRHPAISQNDEPVLSVAERRVVALLLEGFSNSEIAEQLFLSVKTVESHLARVYRRFGVKSRTQLASLLRKPV
jgi:DNA-binding CsgD family transcriptional regulator